jgi:fatty acid desaturase
VEKTFPFSKRMVKIYAIFNLFLSLVSSVVALLIAFHNLLLFIFLYVFPAIFTWSYWAMAPYIEHADTYEGEGVNTRTTTSFVLNFILVGYNYHLCHHLYPRVQLHKLPALHRYLQAHGHLAPAAKIEHSLIKTLSIGALHALGPFSPPPDR